MKKRGSEIILDALIDEGVETIFGYPGGCVIPLFDELLNYPDLKLVLVRHEQAAAHAADGFARVAGKPSVVIATSGPGATNTITGIATAQMDSIPMIIITGQVKRHLIGTDAFQETNVVGVSRPICKHNYLVKDIRNLKKILKEAFLICQTGKPGPVLIDIPVDLQREEHEPEKIQEIKIRGYNPDPINEVEGLVKAWELIKDAKKPVIYAGGGINIANASEELRTFAELSNIPVTTTLLGKGGFPEDHELSLGMLGMHGCYTANTSMLYTDLAITLGARFDDRVTGKTEEFLEQAKIIHIDIDESAINKIKKADIGIVADIKNALKGLISLAQPCDTKEWLAEIKKMKIEFPVPNYDDAEMEQDKLRPEFVTKKLSEITNGNAVIVSDVGQHQMFVALHYLFKNSRSHITSGGLGTMGFALPAAMGVAFHVKDRPVISISGDGGFQMNVQELATLRSYNIPVLNIIYNNNNLGMVKQWQDFFWDSRYAHTIFDSNPNFVKLAEAYSIPAFSTGKKEEVGDIIKEALKIKGPSLIEFKIDKNAHVFPMIPAGGGLRDIILEAPKEIK